MASQTYQPQLPLDLDNNSKFFMISAVLQNVKQKLRMIILTNPGEKIMDPGFGVGINRYLFEPTSGIIAVDNAKISINAFQNTISAKIIEQVYTYASDIVIKNVSIETDEQVLKISIEYNYRGFIDDSLVITLGS